ncbi:MAG: tetratricopeptide repeat protein [Planctomycetota bacterium]
MSTISFLDSETPIEGTQKIPTRIPSSSSTTDAPANVEIPEVIERLAKLAKDLAAVHRVCSEAYWTQGRYEDALQHQDIAVRIDEDEAEYRNQRGFLRYLTGDDGAAEDFEWVIQQGAANHEAHFNLGMLRFGQNNLVEAERNFALAVQYGPDDAESWNNLGVARFQLGRIQEARQCFERSLEINPNYEEAAQNLADCAG